MIKFGSKVPVKKQIQKSTPYLFYMSPVTDFSSEYWNMLLSDEKDLDKNGNFILCKDSEIIFMVNIDINDGAVEGTIELLVLCIQPAAIVSPNAAMTWSDTTNSTVGTFYTNVTDAILASNESGTQYIRVYGQNKKDVNTTAYLPDATNTIKSRTFSADSSSFIIPLYNINMNNYKLGNDNTSKNYVLNSDDYLILPYHRSDATSNGYTTINNSDGANEKSIIQAYMFIPDGITLNVNGTLTIGATVKSTGTIGSRSVLMNEGKINAYSGAKINCFGFLRGVTDTTVTDNIQVNTDCVIDRGVELFESSTFIDVFRIYGYFGGKNSTAISEKNIFPVIGFSINNNSCVTSIHNGSTYKAWASIATSMGNYDETQVIFGSGGLFAFNSTNIKDFCVKSTNDILDEIHNSYAKDISKYQKTIIDIYGDITDNSMEFKYSGSTLFKANTSVSLPVSMIDINLNRGTTIFDSLSYRFLPGSSLYVGKNATMEFGSAANNIFCNDYDDRYTYVYYSDKSNQTTTENYDSYSFIKLYERLYKEDLPFAFEPLLVVDGTLTSKGKLGGRVISNGSGKIIISTSSATLTKISKLTYYNYKILGFIPKPSDCSVSSTTINLIGNINGEENKFGVGTYVYDNELLYWVLQN